MSTTQNYLVIESNVVTNIILWDGNATNWKAPTNDTLLVQATTPTMVWMPTIVDDVITDWYLGQQMGGANIGFTWDGSVCTTNEPKPPFPVYKPVA